MKVARIAASSLGLALILLVAGAFTAEVEDRVKNASFEKGDEHWRLPQRYQVVSDQAASGKRSLYVRRTDPDEYRLASQDVPFEPGAVYAFRCLVRTRKVMGRPEDPSSGSATICMEWAGKDGWIGGAYPEGVRGDTDWLEVRGRTGPIPAEATGVHVTLYLRRGSTGEAWFDDVVVEPYRAPAFRARIVYPPYRGMFLPGYENRGSVAVELASWVGQSADEFVLELVGPAGVRRRIPITKEFPRAPGGPLTFAFARPKRDGPYPVRIMLRQGDELVQQETLEGSVSSAWPKVLADERGRLVVDGEPFFPLGLYAGAVDVSDIDVLRGTPFNCLMPYGSSGADPERMRPYLDAAHQAGVKILYSLKDHFPGTRYFRERVGSWAGGDQAVDGIVRTFRDHPAVWGWYLNDERPPWMRPELRARYLQVRALDPEHPTWSVIAHIDAIGEYVDTCDLLGSDPYPLPNKPLTMVAEWTRKTAQAAPERPVLMVPQLHDKSLYYGGEHRPPTAQEARLMTYLALIEGADGLIFYSLFDLRRDKARGWETRWREALELGEEVRALVPALLDDAPAPAEVRLTPGADQSRLSWRMCSHDGTVYILMANAADQEARADLTTGGRTPALLRPGRGRCQPDGPDRYTVVVPPTEAVTLVLSEP